MSRYNRTNEAPPPPLVTGPTRYAIVDSAGLNTITVLTPTNQLFSTNYVLGYFSTAIGSSIVACLEVVPGLSDIAGNIESFSVITASLAAGASTILDGELSQTSTVTGWGNIISSQVTTIGGAATNLSTATALIGAQSSISTAISSIARTLNSLDISTISTTIAITTVLAQDNSTTVSFLTASTNGLIAMEAGISTTRSTLDGDAVLLSTTKVGRDAFIGLSSQVYWHGIDLLNISTGASTQIAALSTYFVALSSGLCTGISRVEFQGLSSAVTSNSIVFAGISSATDTNKNTLSTLTSTLNTISTVFGAGSIDLASFQGLSTAVLSNSTNLGRISDELCSVIVNLSTLSTTTQGISTSIGIVGGYADLAQFQGLSTYVLGQSTTIDQVNRSLCSQIVNLSSLSSYAVNLSTNLSNTANYVSLTSFQGLSTYVLGQSTTIRGISDSLSTAVISLSSLSTAVQGISSVLGSWNFASVGAFNGLSSYVLTQSTAISGLADGASSAAIIVAGISAVTLQMSTATNTFNILNSSLRYGTGNIINSVASTFTGGTSNSLISPLGVAIGYSNRVSSVGGATAIGFCNMAIAANSFAAGTYVQTRTVDSFTIASGYNVPQNNFIFGGNPQTFMVNGFGRTAAADTYTPLVCWADNAMSTSSNVIVPVIFSNYVMHSVDMQITGYEVPTGATPANGFYAGDYQFFTYWDNTASRSLYICDGVTGATSTLSTTLTAIVATNKLGGAPAVTATVFASTIQAGAQGVYAVAIKSSGANATNWMARLRVGELSSSGIPLGIWPIDYYNPQLNTRTNVVGPLSASPTTVWTVNLLIPFGGSPLIDNANNIYVINGGNFTKILPNGTTIWTIVGAATSENACFTYDKCIVAGYSQALIKYGSYESASAPSQTWQYDNFNSARTDKLSIQQAPIVDENNIIYIRGVDSNGVGARINNIAAVNSNGSGLWIYDVTPNNSVIGNIAVGNCNFVYFARSNGSLFAIDKTTGLLAWTGLSNLIGGTGHTSPPVVGSDGTVYQHGSPNIVYAVNGQTGTTLWSYNSGLNTANFRPFQNILVGQNIYITYSGIATSNGRIIVLNSNGAFQYSNTNSNLPGSNSLLTRLTLDANDTIYGSYSNSCVYFALNGSDLSTKWVINIGIFGGSGASKGSVSIDRSNRAYFCGADSNFYAIQ